MNYHSLNHLSRLVIVAVILFTSMTELLLPFQVSKAQASPSNFLISMFRSRPRGGRSGVWRGDGYCAIAPLYQRDGNHPPIVWSDRPMFVWQGTLEMVEVRSADGQQLVESLDLSQIDANESIHAIRLEQALTPGETYGLVFKVPHTQATLPIPFQVMAASERAQISADLDALAAQGGTAEEIAVRQADYFGDRQLWGDFWQTVLAVENPSAELKDALREAAASVCESTNS